jgi:L-asparaginase II
MAEANHAMKNWNGIHVGDISVSPAFAA